MALPPTIPTSFVPRPAAASVRRFRGDLTGAFGFFAYGAFAVAFALALGVFFYGRILAANLDAKDAAVKDAQAKIANATTESFVRLSNRLTAGEALLEKHVAFSSFFPLLEKLLPASVRFESLHLLLDDAGVSKIEGAGIAKNFNALAVVSNAFAADGRIKDAIFSNIKINKDNSVSFSLSAILDPSLIAFMPPIGSFAATSSPASPSAAQGTAPMP